MLNIWFWISIQNMSSFCVPSESDNIYLHSLLCFNVWVYFWENCFQDFFYCLPKPIMHACLLFIPKTTDIVHWLINERFLSLPKAVTMRRYDDEILFFHRKSYNFIKFKSSTKVSRSTELTVLRKSKSIENLNDYNVSIIHFIFATPFTKMKHYKQESENCKRNSYREITNRQLFRHGCEI